MPVSRPGLLQCRIGCGRLLVANRISRVDINVELNKIYCCKTLQCSRLYVCHDMQLLFYAIQPKVITLRFCRPNTHESPHPYKQ